ncbi:MAG: cobalamin biosynthesis protein CobW [Alphaproteobacteria bacterium]|nr:cobalamin biosynthesis protein CobW [Alphaproteobacteria bacterium]
MNAPNPGRRVPATVITGFLGAGKTSLIRHLINNANGRRLALVINEFGDIGVDEALLRGCGDEACSESDIVELTNGCLCCTVADDFAPAMEKLLARVPQPEHIVIETSGLALPKPLVDAFNWPEIRTRLTVDGVVAVVDGDALRAGRVVGNAAELAAQAAADPALAHDEPVEEVFHDQLACADLVVLSKCDLLSEAEREAALTQLSALVRPGVRVVQSHGSALPATALIGLGAAAEADLAARPTLHDLEGGHDHDDFESIVIAPGPISEPEVFERHLASLAASHGVLRAKGFLDVPGRPRRRVVQGVGPRIDGHYDRPWQADEPRESRVVLIGLRPLDHVAIRAALA